MRPLTFFALLTALTAATATAAQAGPPWGPETPNFNLQAVLRPAAGGTGDGFGLVKFRQPNDGDKIVYLDVWVRDLAPNDSYSLQRATDLNPDDDCQGTNWLTLGNGSVPAAIETGPRGTGRAALSRSLALFPIGTQFDIQFRVIETDSMNVVLESGCYQFTVSQ